MNQLLNSVGIDLGGSWIRVAATDKHGRRIKSHKSPAPPLVSLPTFLRRLWRRWRIQKPVFLTVGSRGVWLLKERRKLQAALQNLADKVSVVSDVELAFESALTSPWQTPGKAAGILILAGTGSIAVGRDARGRVARAGGLGPLKGDEGSGYWIGREYEKRVLGRKQRQTDSVAKVASLAALVVRRAKSDKLCREIQSEAQMHLAQLALTLAGKLNFNGRIPITWAGSLLNDANFRRGFLKQLQQMKSFRFKTVKPKNDPASAAARWAGKLQGFPASFLTTR